MSLFSKLFGGGSKPEPDPEIYKDFRIFPEPVSGQGGYRLGARIEKEIDGELKTHHLVRADRIQSADEAAEFSIRKAKQVIDEQGDRLFG
ncbi:MAG: HlyU family transcriptional regulator [Pseudomonadota bacterium]